MRPSVTVVIPVWNGWDVTVGCLGTLRPTLGDGDDVVVVDNGSVDATAAELTRYDWLTIISNATNLGFARACNQGAAAARGDVVVFLNNDTVLADGWLDRLCAVFADPSVGASGPRSNFVSGPQMVHDAAYDPASYPAWASAWADANRGRVEDVQRLVGFCLAVRRDAFERIGGFDEGFEIGSFEDDDLCCRLSEQGWRLVIAHDAFVHHIGHQTFDANGIDWRAVETANGVRFLEKRRASAGTLTAAVDATGAGPELLEDCIGRLLAQVDEVVVYGAAPGASSCVDALGARVVRGAEDVPRVATSAWTIWTAADEVLDGDLGVVRAILAPRSLPACVRAPVRELHACGSTWREGLTHYAVRLTRRGHGLPLAGDEAAALCELALTHLRGTVHPASTEAEHALEQAMTVVGLGWPEFALPYLETAAEDPGVRDSEWWRSVAMDVVFAGAGAAAVEVLERVAPSDALLRGMAASRAGDLDGALALLSGCDGGPAAVERWRASEGQCGLDGLEPVLLAAVDHGCRDEPAAAARLLEALWARYPGAGAVLAGGSRLRLGAGLESALVWGHRLRAHALPAACPLLLGAATPAVPALDRVKAAAVAWAAFGEETSRQLAARAWPEIETADEATARQFLGAVAPDLLATVAPSVPAPSVGASPLAASAGPSVVRHGA